MNTADHVFASAVVFYFIASRTCNTTVTGSCCIHYSWMWRDPVIFPGIGQWVLSAANQNAWVMTQ